MPLSTTQHGAVASIHSGSVRCVGIKTETTDDLLAVGYFDLRGKPFRLKRTAPAVACFIMNHHNTGSPYAQFKFS